MVQEHTPILSIKNLTSEIIEVTFHSTAISSVAQPGQFLNIKVEPIYPLLRRPFSINNVVGENVSIIFNAIGLGTQLLAKKKVGETIDVVGPCGNSFLSFIDDTFDTAIIVAGGLGVAPFKFLSSSLHAMKKNVTYLGARNSSMIVRDGLSNPHIATDDGSEGFHGTVLDLMKADFAENDYGKIKFFTCGPTRMMQALAAYAKEINVDCFASIECSMACGIGLCQGCNIEVLGSEKKYTLVCKEGTIFETKTITL